MKNNFYFEIQDLSFAALEKFHYIVYLAAGVDIQQALSNEYQERLSMMNNEKKLAELVANLERDWFHPNVDATIKIKIKDRRLDNGFTTKVLAPVVTFNSRPHHDDLIKIRESVQKRLFDVSQKYGLLADDAESQYNYQLNEKKLAEIMKAFKKCGGSEDDSRGFEQFKNGYLSSYNLIGEQD